MDPVIDPRTELARAYRKVGQVTREACNYLEFRNERTLFDLAGTGPVSGRLYSEIGRFLDVLRGANDLVKYRGVTQYELDRFMEFADRGWLHLPVDDLAKMADLAFRIADGLDLASATADDARIDWDGLMIRSTSPYFWITRLIGLFGRAVSYALTKRAGWVWGTAILASGPLGAYIAWWAAARFFPEQAKGWPLFLAMVTAFFGMPGILNNVASQVRK